MGIGTLYGISVRFLAESQLFAGVFWVMSYAFVLVAPFVIGFLTVRPRLHPSIAYRLFAPWLPVLLGSGVSMLIGLEGSICVIIGLPLILVGASLGGLTAAAVSARYPVPTGVLMVLPIAFGALETTWPIATQTHRVETYIDINATPAEVWHEIVSVREITRIELPDALYLRMGFPRPLSALIDRPGVGAVRQATFAGGLLFVETVTEWELNRRLGFRIAPDLAELLPTTLDPHVVVGGPYFDVFQGTYWIEGPESGPVRLHLASDLRVSTNFNWYSSLWADRIMESIQRTILQVEKQRAESVPGAT